ncbi:MAG TPA: NAD(P)H-dependent oxidoreductase subunit E [Gemmatimonadaceae bacterium]
MDLHLLDAEPSPAERDAIDGTLGLPASGWEGGERTAVDAHLARGGAEMRARRHLLLPALHAAQSRVGWISEGALNYACTRLGVPPAEAWGVATFYALFATAPRPARVLHVCDDIACRCRGSSELIAELERTVGPAWEPPPGGAEPIEVPASGWMKSPCLGMCDHAPAAFLCVAGEEPHEELLGGVSAGTARDALEPESHGARSLASLRLPRTSGPSAAVREPDGPEGDGTVLLRRVGVVDPGSIDAYRAAGGYEALRKALEMGPAAVIREVTDSKLVGRGGAAFPMGRKWEAVAAQAARPHYLVCNADESEPGTFKDRVLLEGDPFAIVEAMTIAGFATGCEMGYLYIRGEYPVGLSRIQDAIEQARARGLLGDDVMGRGVRFDIELRKGAGAYICGEETAIFNSIEGFRGEPRNKPPFPVQAGLFGRPTVVNNVETLANVLPIVLHGGAEFARTGTPLSTGTKLFCLSGNVQRPGTYEVPFGTTLRALLDLAGGVEAGHTLKAILLGGAAGVFVGPEALDTPLTFEGARAIGATIGSGVVLVFDERADMAGMVLRVAEFFRDESCGQCVPCRVGTVRQEEALHRIVANRPIGSVADELALLEEVGVAMRDASICGLGQTAYSAVESAIKRLKIVGGRAS